MRTGYWLSGMLLVLLGTNSGVGQERSAEAVTDTSELVFASVAKGQDMISVSDSYMGHIQDLERQLRVGADGPVTEEAFVQFLKDGVLEWKPEEIVAMRKIIARVREKLEPYDLPLPKEIFLIRIKPNVEFGAPHCRAASILLPDRFFAAGDNMTASILAHELFHVLSSHNPKLRDKLYSIIGFTRCNEVELPEGLLPRRLTNPDAPSHEHYIELEFDDGKFPALPVTMMRSEEPQPGGIGGNLDLQLMLLEKKGDAFVPKMKDGKPDLRAPNSTPDFMRQIGRNTGYIIHPEETLADNFWMMLFESPRIRDQWVVEKLDKALME